MLDRLNLFAGRLLVSLCLIAGIARTAAAQPLADRVPDDAILYIGFTGSNALPPEYAQSHLKAVLDQSKLRELFTQFMPQVFGKIISNDPQAEQPLNTLMTLGAPMWKYPSAIFFAGLDFSNPRQPFPRAGIICRAGADAEKMHLEISALLDQAGAADAPFPISAFRRDDLVGVLIGYDDESKAIAGLGAGGVAPIKSAEAFTEAMRHVQPDPVFIGYLDVERLIARVEGHVQDSGDPQVQEMVPKVLDATGLRGLRRWIGTAGFDGQDWMSMSFIDAPAPRKGLLELIDGKPVSPDLLKAIPGDATFVATGRFDPARLVAQIKKVAGDIDPEFPKFVDMGLGGAQVALEKNLVTDIFEPLGEDWAIYCSPTVAGNGILGLAVINKLDDPAKAQASLPTAWINLSNWVAVAMTNAKAEVEVRGRYTKIGDLTVYYVGLPIVAPSWAIKDGFLYGGLFPQTIAGAARSTSKGGKSIAENERFIALQKRLGVKDPCGFSFFDLPTTASAGGSTYQQLLMLTQYAGFGDLFGVPAPQPLMPPLDVILQHIAPAGSATWVDDAGVHTKSVTPFPGAKMLSEPGMFSSVGGVGMGALAMSILLPSMNRARETAQRVQCASNMKQIGVAVMMHANDNNGNYPPDLGTLIRSEYVTIDPFICPSGHTGYPENLGDMTRDQIADWVNENSPYIYVGQELAGGADAQTIIMYEDPADHEFDGVNALFADGHIEYLRLNEARQRLEAQGLEMQGGKR